mmetsp:Transcript_15439/g.35594  ORF Transcript_15439/g.35594 Transcript_15439/m.35594 type:complete len:117 (+) Transcript_15439:1878-2228(+)
MGDVATSVTVTAEAESAFCSPPCGMKHDLGTNASVDARYGRRDAVAAVRATMENLIFLLRHSTLGTRTRRSSYVSSISIAAVWSSSYWILRTKSLDWFSFIGCVPGSLTVNYRKRG